MTWDNWVGFLYMSVSILNGDSALRARCTLNEGTYLHELLSQSDNGQRTIGWR